MGDLWVQMLAGSDQELRTLKAELQTKHVTEEVVGYEMMIRGAPGNVALRNDAAVIYTEMGRLNDAVRHLEVVVQLQPDSAAAHYNLGTTLAAMNDVTRAAVEYRQAIDCGPTTRSPTTISDTRSWRWRDRRGDRHFREAARLDPQNAAAQYNIGMIARERGDILEAIAQLRNAVRLQPDWVQAVAQLAWILATTPARHCGTPTRRFSWRTMPPR